MNYKEEISGLKVTVLGAARSGISAARLLKRLGAIPFVSDISDEVKMMNAVNQLRAEQIDYEFSEHSERVFDASFVIVSPGVPTDSKIVKEFIAKGIRVISEVEFASHYFNGVTIAITGTNGKTTTTSLMEHILKTAIKKVVACGNIGTAFSDVILRDEKYDYAALEVSSFQLDSIENFKPRISVILNITPDHLNRYDNSFEKYTESKLRIFMNQTQSEVCIINEDDDLLRSNSLKINARVFKFSTKTHIEDGAFLTESELVYNENNIEKFRCKLSDISLKGEHNYANAMAVVIAAKQIGISNEDILKGLITFLGVEHRLEFVRNFNGVRFINDSKATNVDSVWYALNSFENPIILILGGLDKGNDYSKIENLVKSKVKKIYAIGSSSDKVFEYFNNFVPVQIAETLEECVSNSTLLASEGDIVLLSPACASFDMFNNYEHRGEVFKKTVESL
ncbi:MAG TPA: UDP-N-acetylmuramoyl-L-alanine--D-glutamate ligase [Bacteroidetes bacterium]|nr:UDP-N-acetylmuramoyl-L-alanine--D-glutamate ligase [Bacteroidota bacterium]HRI45833.1 UDP-N-acetylmuramoyl-L-alanine--D-glutamate ligase [Ignavibacteriaceae bacterium]